MYTKYMIQDNIIGATFYTNDSQNISNLVSRLGFVNDLLPDPGSFMDAAWYPSITHAKPLTLQTDKSFPGEHTEYQSKTPDCIILIG